MKQNEGLHHRRSIRLKGYDYAQVGEYFLTLCIQNRECLLGKIENEEVKLSAIGEIAGEEWLRTPEIRPNVELDEFVIMPNHLHGIVVIREERKGVSQKEKISRGGVLPYAPTTTATPFRSPSGTVGAIIRGFKAASTKRINEMRRTPGAPVWQRNYYEHVIRDENDLDRIREYILMNPAGWTIDEENPWREKGFVSKGD